MDKSLGICYRSDDEVHIWEKVVQTFLRPILAIVMSNYMEF